MVRGRGVGVGFGWNTQEILQGKAPIQKGSIMHGVTHFHKMKREKNTPSIIV